MTHKTIEKEGSYNHSSYFLFISLTLFLTLSFFFHSIAPSFFYSPFIHTPFYFFPFETFYNFSFGCVSLERFFSLTYFSSIFYILCNGIHKSFFFISCQFFSQFFILSLSKLFLFSSLSLSFLSFFSFFFLSLSYILLSQYFLYSFKFQLR